MKASNYVQIQGWMVSDLGLKGNHLLAYALIYGFSQDGNSQFTGSIKYICKWLNCSRGTVIKVLKDLTNRKLLIKEQVTINNVTYNKYAVKFSNPGSTETVPPIRKLHRGSTEIGAQSSSETVPNNTIINNTTNNEFSERDFLKDWNKYRLKHLNKPSHVMKLSRDENGYLNDLSKDYSRDDFQCALIGLFKQKKMPNGNTTMQSNPKHFLTHFNAYLTAFYDRNTSLYGQDKPENL